MLDPLLYFHMTKLSPLGRVIVFLDSIYCFLFSFNICTYSPPHVLIN